MRRNSKFHSLFKHENRGLVISAHKLPFPGVDVFVIDLQNVNITLRILFRPIADRLPDIFTNLGIDYDERVLPSIVNEVMKAVVVSTLSSCILVNVPYFVSLHLKIS